MRIVILGAPSSGRAAQAKMLAERYKVPQISVETLLREALAAGAVDGKTVAALKSGRTTADDLVLNLLAERLRGRDGKRGFIIDDFPRNIPQAQSLDTLLGMFGWTLQIALHISVDRETLVKRITGRQKCQSCGAVYNRIDSPPRRRGKCDECDGKVTSDNPGTPKAARVMVDEYLEKSEALLTYYKAQHKLRTVTWEKNADIVQKKICEIVDLEIRPLEIRPLETAAQTHDEEINTVIVGGKISRVAPQTAKPKRAKKSASKKTKKKPAAKKSSKKSPRKKPVTKKPTSKKLAKKKPTTRKKPAAKVSKTSTRKKVTKKKVAKKKVTPKKATKKATKKS